MKVPNWLTQLENGTFFCERAAKEICDDLVSAFGLIRTFTPSLNNFFYYKE